MWFKHGLLIYMLALQAARIFSKVHFKTGNCTYNAKYFKNFTLDMRNSAANVDIQVIQTLPAKMMAKVSVNRLAPNGKTYTNALDRTIDICKLAASMQSSLFKRMFLAALRHGNFVKTCPVPIGRYYINDFSYSSVEGPHTSLFAGKYKIMVHIFYGIYKTKSEEFIVHIEVDALIQ